MPKTITLKYAGRCKDCGASLAVGERARYYGRGHLYGLDCHPRPSDLPHRPTQTHPDPKPYPCEDAPCCGCCGSGTDDPAYAIEEPYEYEEGPERW